MRSWSVGLISGAMLGCSSPSFTSAHSDAGVDGPVDAPVDAPISPTAVSATMSVTELVWHKGYLYFGDTITHTYQRMAPGPQPVFSVIARINPSATLFDLAVDDVNIYFTPYQPETVYACAVSGCGSTPTPIFAAPLPDAGANYATYVAADGTNVFFLTREPASLWALEGTTSALELVSPMGNDWASLAVNSTRAFWFDDSGSVQSADKAMPNGTPITIAPLFGAGTGARDLVADDAYVWAVSTAGMGVGRIPAGGGPLASVPRSNACAVAVDDTHLYWIESDGSAGAGSVYRMTKSSFPGGAIDTIADRQTIDPARSTIAVGDSDVYWYATTGGTGAIWAAPK